MNELPTFTSDHAEAAYRRLRYTFKLDKRWANAIDKAAALLPRTHWQWDARRRELLIDSQSTLGLTTYHVTAKGCQCRAAEVGHMCWHMAAFRILRSAQELAEIEASRTKITTYEARYSIHDMYN